MAPLYPALVVGFSPASSSSSESSDSWAASALSTAGEGNAVGCCRTPRSGYIILRVIMESKQYCWPDMNFFCARAPGAVRPAARPAPAGRRERRTSMSTICVLDIDMYIRTLDLSCAT